MKGKNINMIRTGFDNLAKDDTKRYWVNEEEKSINIALMLILKSQFLVQWARHHCPKRWKKTLYFIIFHLMNHWSPQKLQIAHLLSWIMVHIHGTKIFIYSTPDKRPVSFINSFRSFSTGTQYLQIKPTVKSSIRMLQWLIDPMYYSNGS